jgi:hypothetical protein
MAKVHVAKPGTRISEQEEEDKEERNKRLA